VCRPNNPYSLPVLLAYGLPWVEMGPTDDR
jgi:hypothetical protein